MSEIEKRSLGDIILFNGRLRLSRCWYGVIEVLRLETAEQRTEPAHGVHWPEMEIESAWEDLFIRRRVLQGHIKASLTRGFSDPCIPHSTCTHFSN
jgi:hypothetical protein